MLSLMCTLIIGASPAEPLSSLRALTKSIHYIKEASAEPKAIRPRDLFVGAVQGAARAEPLIQFSNKKDVLTVKVGAESRTFQLTELDRLWKMAFALKDVADLAEHGLKGQKGRVDARAIEAAMIDSMLRALKDGHSRVLGADEQRSGTALEGGLCVMRVELENEIAMKLVVFRENCATAATK